MELAWKLEKDKKGVRIYTREHANSPYRAYKAEMIVEGSMAPYLSVFEDVSSYKSWMHTTVHSELVKQPGENEKHIYMVNRNLPIVDRDYYAKLVSTQELDGSVRVSWELLDMPTHKGRVRVNKLDVLISLVPMESNTFRVILDGHFEPGGFVPAALANAFITDVPYKTFLKIRKLAAARAGQLLSVPSYVEL